MQRVQSAMQEAAFSLHQMSTLGASVSIMRSCYSEPGMLLHVSCSACACGYHALRVPACIMLCVCLRVSCSACACGYHALRVPVGAMLSVFLWVPCSLCSCGCHALCVPAGAMLSMFLWVPCSPCSCGCHALRVPVGAMLSVSLECSSVSIQLLHFCSRCGHCKTLTPNWESAAREMDG